MGFGQAISSGFSNYVNFSGRSSRSEYWFWVLFVLIADVVAIAIERVHLLEQRKQAEASRRSVEIK